MKISIALAIVISLFVLAPQVHAQHRIHHRMHTQSMMNQSDTSTTAPGGAEVSGITGSAPGDPYNINHPFFQGSARWSNADTLYKHGDFPWALVSQHPEDFQFNAATGQWQVSSTANLGKTK